MAPKPTLSPPLPPLPGPGVPAIPGATTTTTVPGLTPVPSGGSTSTIGKSNQTNTTRLGTVPMEKKKGGWNLIPTYLRSAGDMVLNAGPGMVHFFGGAGVDIVQAFGDLGAMAIGVDYQPGYGTTNQLINSVKGTGSLIKDISQRGSAITSATRPIATPKGVYLPSSEQKPFSPRGAGRYEEAIKNNQSILPYIIEDAGNVMVVGSVLKGAGRGITYGGRVVAGESVAEASAAASQRAATRGLPGLNVVVEDTAMRSARQTVGKGIQNVGKAFTEVGTGIIDAGNTMGLTKVMTAPFLPYSLGRKAFLNLWREGVYVGGDSAYVGWGLRAAKKFTDQIKKLRDEGVPSDDPIIVDLEKRRQQAASRSMTQLIKKETNEAVRDRGSERGAVVRGIINEIENPLHKDVINPETGQPYGRLSQAEAQAVIAVLNGTAQMVLRMQEIFGDKLTPKMIALLGRYDLYPEFALTPEGANIAYGILKPDSGILTQEMFERVSYAMDNLGKAIVNNMTERAIKGYGRRNPLPPEYLVPQPMAEKLGKNVYEGLRKAERDLVNVNSKSTSTAAEKTAAMNRVIEMQNLVEMWETMVEAGIPDLPLNHPDRINSFKAIIDQLPDELALDSSMYSAAQRIPLEFYRRFRAAMGRHIIEGTVFEDTGPKSSGPEGGLKTPRTGKANAVDVELAQRERTVTKIEADIEKIGEQIHKKEAQHAKIVEKIVRYDIVDEYLAGKSEAMIAGERGVTIATIKKIIDASPAANTFKRMQKIAKSIREMQAAYDGVIDETELAYIQNQVDGLKAQVAELQNQYVAYKAEEAAARKVVEDLEEAASGEILDLETNMENYEAEYELAGGVVDDLWNEDTPAVSAKPVEVVETFLRNNGIKTPAIGGERKVFNIDSYSENGLTTEITVEYNAGYKNLHTEINIFVTKENQTYHALIDADKWEDSTNPFDEAIEGIEWFIEAINGQNFPQGLEGNGYEIDIPAFEFDNGKYTNQSDVIELTNSLGYLKEQIQKLATSEPGSKAASKPGPKLTAPNKRGFERTPLADPPPAVDTRDVALSFNALIGPKKAWKRGDAEVYTPEEAAASRDNDNPYYINITKEGYANSDELSWMNENFPGRVIIAFDFSSKGFIPHADKAMLAVPDTWQEFKQNLINSINDIQREIDRGLISGGWYPGAYVGGASKSMFNGSGSKASAQKAIKKLEAVLEVVEKQIAAGEEQIYTPGIIRPGETSKRVPVKPALSPVASPKVSSRIVEIEKEQDSLRKEIDALNNDIADNAEEKFIKSDTPAQTKKSRSKYVKAAIKSGKPFFIEEYKGKQYFSDSYLVIPIEYIDTTIPLPKENGRYAHTGGRATPTPETIGYTEKYSGKDRGPVEKLMELYLDKEIKKFEQLTLDRKETLSSGEEIIIFKDSTGSEHYISKERFDVFPYAQYLGIPGVENKPIIVKSTSGSEKLTGLVMPIRSSQVEIQPATGVSAELENSKAEKESRIAELEQEKALLQKPAPTPAPTPAPAPLRPKAKTPAEVQVDPKIKNEAIQRAVYYADLADAAAAEASALLNNAQTLTDRLAYLERYFEESAKYDLEVAKLAIQLEVAQRARNKKEEIESKLEELRLKQVELSDNLGPAKESVEAILSHPYYEGYGKLKGNIPLDVAMGGNFPTDIGGYSLPDLEGNTVSLSGPMYVPSGGPKKFYGGVSKEVTEEGLVGWRELKSEHYRDGDRHVIFSLEQVAIRMGQEVSMMTENERYRFIIATYGETASKILGDDFTQKLYERAVQWADNYDAATLRSMFTEEWQKAQQDANFVEGIASYAPGIPNPAQAREFAIRKRYGELIAESMKEYGYSPIDPYKNIESLYPERDITANRLVPVDEGIDPADLEPPRENIVPETMFLPEGMREVMMQVVVAKKNSTLTKLLKGSAAVTSMMKTTTLVFSIPWQLGDILSSIQIAKAANIPFSTFVQMMNLVIEQEFGKPTTPREALEMTKRMILPNAEPMTPGPVARIALESQVQDLGQTAQERNVLYPGTLQPKKRLTRRLADVTGIEPVAKVGEVAEAVTGTSFKINSTINKIMRHAFFFSKLDEALRARGMTLESLNNDSNASWRTDPELRKIVDESARSANDWLGDYANLNMKERMYFSQAFPFYSWMRHIHHVFNLVLDTNPEFLAYYLYIGSLYMNNAEEDPMNLRRGSISAFGGLSSANFINPFADVVGGPLFSIALERNVKPLGQSIGPVPRLAAGAVGWDITKMRTLSRPTGTGSYDEAGNLTYGGPLFSPSEALGFTLQQFPIAQRIMNINPTPFENIPGTRIALGPVSRYQTGEARTNPVTGQRLESPGGRLAATARLFGTPLVPYRTDEQLNQVMVSARGRLATLEEILRRREIEGAP